MSRKSSNRVNFSPDIYKSPAILIKHKHRRYTTTKHHLTDSSGNWVCRVLPPDNKHLYSRPLRFLRRLGDKTVRVLRFIGTGKTSSKVVSSPTGNLMRSRSLVDQSESHRAQAIEDCIEFLHSYSSLQRSSSMSS